MRDGVMTDSPRRAFDLLLIAVRQDAASGRLVRVCQLRLIVRAGRRNLLIRLRLLVEIAVLGLLCHANRTGKFHARSF